MANPNSNVSPGGRGGGGAGLTLGPAPNTFTAATRAAAETLRDSGITGTLLAQYDAEPTFNIILNWPATPTNTVYQARRGGSWADVTGIIRGPRGLAGATGATGSDGAAGSDGSDGAAGADGTTWHNVTGVPQSSLGSDGDWALYATASVGHFYQKVSGAWVLRFTTDAVAVAVGSHTRYFGWSADRVIETSDFASASTSTSDDGQFPTITMNGYPWIGIPVSPGAPSQVFLFDDFTSDEIDTFEVLASNVDDSNGDPHVIMVAHNQQVGSAWSEQDVSLRY